jgi:hypothetical protein
MVPMATTSRSIGNSCQPAGISCSTPIRVVQPGMVRASNGLFGEAGVSIPN